MKDVSPDEVKLVNKCRYVEHDNLSTSNALMLQNVW